MNKKMQELSEKYMDVKHHESVLRYWQNYAEESKAKISKYEKFLKESEEGIEIQTRKLAEAKVALKKFRKKEGLE